MYWRSILFFGGVFVIYRFGGRFSAFTYLQEAAFFWTATLASLPLVFILLIWTIQKNQIRLDQLKKDFQNPKQMMNLIKLILIMGLVPYFFHVLVNVVNVSFDQSLPIDRIVEIVKRSKSSGSSKGITHYIDVKGLGPKIRRLKVSTRDYFNRFAEEDRHLAQIRSGALGFAYVDKWLDAPQSAG